MSLAEGLRLNNVGGLCTEFAGNHVQEAHYSDLHNNTARARYEYRRSCVHRGAML